jgi:DNA-binding winged helix-turn-helix (wHTH) protein
MDLSRHPEFWKIAVTLIGRKGKVVETDVLTERHDDDSYVESSTLRSDVSKLNKKFKLLCLVARSIPRLGYKLEEISESTDKNRLAHT